MSYIQFLKDEYNNLINAEQEKGLIVIDPNKHVLLRTIEAISIIIFNELDKLFVKKLHLCTNSQKLMVEILEYNNRGKIDCIKKLEYRKYLINIGLLENLNEISEDSIEYEIPAKLVTISIFKNHLRAIQTIFAANFKLVSNNKLLKEKNIKVPFVTSSNTEAFFINLLKWNNWRSTENTI